MCSLLLLPLPAELRLGNATIRKNLEASVFLLLEIFLLACDPATKTVATLIIDEGNVLIYSPNAP